MRLVQWHLEREADFFQRANARHAKGLHAEPEPYIRRLYFGRRSYLDLGEYMIDHALVVRGRQSATERLAEQRLAVQLPAVMAAMNVLRVGHSLLTQWLASALGMTVAAEGMAPVKHASGQPSHRMAASSNVAPLCIAPHAPAVCNTTSAPGSPPTSAPEFTSLKQAPVAHMPSPSATPFATQLVPTSAVHATPSATPPPFDDVLALVQPADHRPAAGTPFHNVLSTVYDALAGEPGGLDPETFTRWLSFTLAYNAWTNQQHATQTAGYRQSLVLREEAHARGSVLAPTGDILPAGITAARQVLPALRAPINPPNYVLVAGTPEHDARVAVLVSMYNEQVLLSDLEVGGILHPNAIVFVDAFAVGLWRDTE